MRKDLTCKKCLWCKSSFFTSHGNHKFCSAPCRNNHTLSRQTNSGYFKDYYIKHRERINSMRRKQKNKALDELNAARASTNVLKPLSKMPDWDVTAVGVRHVKIKENWG